MTTVDINNKMLVFPLENLVGTVIWLLQGSSSGIMTDKDMWIAQG